MEPYGGWESGGSGLRGEFAGHFIMALATAAAATDDGKERAELRARADYVVRVLGEC